MTSKKTVDAAQKLLDIVEKLHQRAEPYRVVKPWLPQDASAAFIVCIGAGPWTYPRRRKIQYEGLQQLNGRDIADLTGTEKWFPLDWQNEMLNTLTVKLKTMGREHWFAPPSMTRFVTNLRKISPIMARDTFYHACGRPHGTKVLSLYLRDYVQVPCFPIDRHVKRSLQELRLPTREDSMLDLCNDIGVDPIPIARLLIGGKLIGGNPDWSHWPAEAAAEEPGKRIILTGFPMLDEKLKGGFKVGELVVLAGPSHGPRTILPFPAPSKDTDS